MKTAAEDIVCTTIFNVRYMTDAESVEALNTWAKVGGKVVVSCDPDRTVRTVVAHIPSIMGGVVIDPPLDNFYKSWNVDALEAAP